MARRIASATLQTSGQVLAVTGKFAGKQAARGWAALDGLWRAAVISIPIAIVATAFLVTTPLDRSHGARLLVWMVSAATAATIALYAVLTKCRVGYKGKWMTILGVLTAYFLVLGPLVILPLIAFILVGLHKTSQEKLDEIAEQKAKAERDRVKEEGKLIRQMARERREAEREAARPARSHSMVNRGQSLKCPACGWHGNRGQWMDSGNMCPRCRNGECETSLLGF